MLIYTGKPVVVYCPFGLIKPHKAKQKELKYLRKRGILAEFIEEQNDRKNDKTQPETSENESI